MNFNKPTIFNNMNHINYYNLKKTKGAMFGLDARIALAIFGALSVISGAALYSAIQQSKVVAIVTEMTEIGKAVEQYYLDTGSLPPVSSAQTNSRNIFDLVENNTSANGWNGPYLSHIKNSNPANTHVLMHNNYGYVKVFSTRIPTWASFAAADIECLTTKLTCNTWVVFHEVEPNILKAIETYVDGTASPGDNNFEGNFRYMSSVKDGGLFTGPTFKP